jgi:SAM-dependent methyltransferase
MGDSLDLSFLVPPGQVVDWRMVVLFDALAEAGVLARLPGTADEVAAALDLDRHALRVVLDALATFGIVEGRAGTYALGPDAPEDGGGAALRHHARAIRRWSGAIDDRLRGRPPEEGEGMLRPEVFLQALGASARQAAPAVVDLCLARFPDARTVLDLGALHGRYALEFTRRGLEATMQDLPQMIQLVEDDAELAAAGVQLFAGSFFDAVPEGPFDLAFCAGITHTFDADRNRALYRNLRRVVSPGGGVALVTFLRNRQPLSDLFAVQMLVNAGGGDTHAEDEYRAWLGECGFEVDEAVIDVPRRGQSILFATPV